MEYWTYHEKLREFETLDGMKHIFEVEFREYDYLVTFLDCLPSPCDDR